MRKIWGGLIPSGKVWRTGADEATLFITQKPIVRVGQKVHKGQVMADGPCTELGELALGLDRHDARQPAVGAHQLVALVGDPRGDGLVVTLAPADERGAEVEVLRLARRGEQTGPGFWEKMRRKDGAG